MGYINKKLQNLIKYMDKTFSVGLGVRKWLSQSIYLKHNLVLKPKEGYYCTNCKNKFHSTVKVGEYTICPKCKQELLVRMKTLQYQVFKDDFRILEFIDGCFVLRGFEVLSRYSNYQVSHKYQEYQRLVISKDKIYLLASNLLKNYMGYLSVSHNEKHTSWRLLDSQYRWYMSRGSIYWGGLERDTDGTLYHYCPIQRVLQSYTGDTTLNGNAFKFRFNEDMKYWILRYLVVSVFMNRIKSKTVTRTHRSIVKALVVDTGVETISYYDALMDKRHPHKYLSRYIQRLKEVLEMLKDMEFIKDYSIETITNIQELQTGCGLVRITPNMSNRIHRTRTYLSK